LEEIDDETLKGFLQLIHRKAGITIAPSRKAMLQGRLRSRMRPLGLSGFHDYLRYLDEHPEEMQAFLDVITTNETYFYRTPRIWEHIEKKVLPDWVARKEGSIFTAWSAAASSGEEASTLAVILQSFKEKNPTFQYRVIGTDLSTQILAQAEKGLYSGRSIESFRKAQPELFRKYMVEKEPGSFGVAPEIRARIEYRHHNLMQKLKVTAPFDLVLIRNVLIYFDAKEQQTILNHVSQVIKPSGVVIIGESESLNHLQTRFVYQQPLVYALGSSDNAKQEAA
jgi:chemotaxis protein methyltransferase CheR